MDMYDTYDLPGLKYLFIYHIKSSAFRVIDYRDILECFFLLC